MKVSFIKSAIAQAVAATSPVVPAKPSIPTLRGILIAVTGDTATFSASDGQSHIITTAGCETDEDGTILIPGRLLANIVNQLPEKVVTLDVSDQEVHVSCGRSTFKIPAMTVDDYPPLPETPDVAGDISGHTFTNAISAVKHSASSDDTLPMLTGVRIEAEGDTITLVTTDRFRLSTRKIGWGGENFTALVDAKGLSDAAKIVGSQPAKILFDGHRFGVHVEGTTFITRIIDADFPKWRALVAKTSTSAAHVGRRALVDAVKRVTMVNPTDPRVMFNVEQGRITVGSIESDGGSASEIIDCDLDGEPISISFNGKYVQDAVSGFDGDRVLLTMTDEKRPGTFWDDTSVDEGAVPDSGDLTLVMPVTIKG